MLIAGFGVALGTEGAAGAEPVPQHTAGSTAGSAAGSSVHFAKVESLCPDSPAPGQATCFAMRRVPVPAGTRGAIAYATPAAATGPAGGFTPGDLVTAYGIPNPDAATSITVGIVDAYDDPYALAELNAFDAQYGLLAETATSFRKVNQNGATSPLPAANSGWAGEIALDLQAVRGLCHRCKIVLVEATDANNNNLATAVNRAVTMGAKVVSNSYGGPEYNATADAAAYNHPGVVMLASTGDHGWYNWDFANDVPNGTYDSTAGASDNAPNTPAAYPTVVAVTGTALALNADATRSEEDVWNENGPDDQNGLSMGYWWGDSGASGGGCSTIYAAPSFQRTVAGWANTRCGTKRATGDVAALADPATGYDIYSQYNSGWITIGGTSLASPLVAAMWALAGGSGGVKYPAQNLYDNLRWHPSARYDIQLGGNGFCAGDSMSNCSATLQAETSPATGNPNNLANGSTQWDSTNPPQGSGWAGLLDCSYPHDGSEVSPGAISGECNALAGYDGASGVGAAHGLQLFRSMQPKVVVHLPSVLKLNTAETFTATITDPAPSSSIVSSTWTFGDGSAASSSATHTYTKAGTFTVTLKVKDNYGRIASGSAKFTVGKALTVKFTGPTTAHVNHAYSFSSSGSTTPNTGASILKTVWHFGDGTAAVTATSTTHTYAHTGTFTISETVYDNRGVATTRKVGETVVS